VRSDDTPPIWVISLSSAAERRRFVVEGFGGLNIPFELVEAVDGNTLSAAQWGSYSRRRALLEIGRPMSRGELGCALSHLQLYERMQRDDVARAVIVEDDVTPTADLLPVLRELHRVPDDWDVITLHSLFEASDPQPVTDDVIAGRFRVCRYRRAVFGTQCYVITRAGAARAMSAAQPLAMPLDELLFRDRPARLHVYGIEPKVVHEGTFESELVARSDSMQDERLTATDRAAVMLGKVRRRARKLHVR
jgi:glycosyl transferase family 25